MTTYQHRDHHRTARSFKVMRGRDRASWRTSTAPAAVSMALLTGLAMAIALGFRELVRFAMTFMGA